MSKRQKKSSKKARRKRQRADERMAETALRKWLAVQESAAIMNRDYAYQSAGANGIVAGQNVKMFGTSVSFNGGSQDQWLASTMAEAVRNASIFILNPDQYGAYYNEADIYTTRVVAEQEWVEPVGMKSPAFAIGMSMMGFNVPDDARAEKWMQNPDEGREHYERITREGKMVPVPDPEKWPFETMWISFGQGVNLTSTMAESRLNSSTYETFRFDSLGLLGQLWIATPKGPLIVEAIEFHADVDDAGLGGVGILWATAYSPGDLGWNHPYDLNPWICNAIHKHLLDFRTFVIEREWKAHQRKPDYDIPRVIEHRPIPKPYYLVKLKSQTITQNFATAMPPRRKFEYQHRFMVRGHERVRVRRGPMPLPADVREELEQRHYTIYTINEMSREHARMLQERGIPVKRSHEWLAILVSWVKPHEKGPEDGPFVPSVRLA